MPGQVVRFADYERKSRDCDAVIEERDPTVSAVVIILPMIRIERHVEPRKRTKRKSK